jgi:hypothetical protein
MIVLLTLSFKALILSPRSVRLSWLKLFTFLSNALLLLKVLEGRLREEAELARRLGLRYRDSDAALRDVTEERSVYITMLEDARATINQQQDELKDTRYTYIYTYIYIDTYVDVYIYVYMKK